MYVKIVYKNGTSITIARSIYDKWVRKEPLSINTKSLFKNVVRFELGRN
jgi:acyl-CoA hydrolase